jgi:tetratricopeptide (TPR) repeat protein
MIAIVLLATLAQEPPVNVAPPPPAATAPQQTQTPPHGGQAPSPVQTAPAPTEQAGAPVLQAKTEEFTRAVFFGKKFYDLHDYASAYDQYAKADALHPDNPAVLYNMAAVLAKAGRYSEAQTKVDRYLQLFPAGNERAIVQKLQLELEFQRELQKKRQADESYLELFNRGRFLYTKNDLDGALKLYQEAEQQRPNDPAPVFNQAVIFEKLGDLAKAAERFHRYDDIETDADAKAAVGQRLLVIESELDDMKSKIVCLFCGLKLPAGATWCPRCWHGPYLTSSGIWSSRPCVDGATATRATYYSDGRFAKNDTLPCLYNVPLREAVRYSPSRQHAIQDARKAEGWTYNGDIIQALGDRVKYIQGGDYLEKVVAPQTGELLNYSAHSAGDSGWLLDREDLIIDGQKYTARYTFDASNRIAQEQVEYQNTAACDHLISMTADYAYTSDALQSVKIHGGYDGFAPEGSPRVDWDANVVYAYDANGRLAKEELNVSSITKTYAQKPSGSWRDEVGKLYVSMRARRPVENVSRIGDLCATNGTTILGNYIDLRPFYAMSPNLAMQVPFGVTRATVTFTYPDSYRPR